MSYELSRVAVSFALVGGAVLDFDLVQIGDGEIVCLGCAAVREQFGATDH